MPFLDKCNRLPDCAHRVTFAGSKECVERLGHANRSDGSSYQEYRDANDKLSSKVAWHFQIHRS
ncbi:hypothetical protein [Aeoliella sp. SH292]|uniref:hypothetical protein n=1 Tax=Aeoliella sp. SH292 TaxID=3454464 RepID=UPI003F97900B